MSTIPQSLIVAGIDVGGRRKGMHAVALRDGLYHDQCSSTEPAKIVEWCRKTVQAQVVAIDTPCRWSTDGRARPAERALMTEKRRIWCFSTPTRDKALHHPKKHYDWMLQGEALFTDLETTHMLCLALPFPVGTQRCFETFPHAITSSLTKKPVFARNKRSDREALLRAAQINISTLTSIDFVDAALCALAAHHAASGKPCRSYGESATGLIIVPATP